MPAKEWTWGHDSWGYHGVHTREGKLVWFRERQDRYGSAGLEQAFEDFLQNGPAGPDPPAHVVSELKALLRKHLPGREP